MCDSGSPFRPREEALSGAAPRFRGAVMVEAMIVLPLLLMFILGVLDFGYLFKNYLEVIRALNIAGREVSALSAMSPTAPQGGELPGIVAADCLKYAGRVFSEQLKRRGVSLADVSAFKEPDKNQRVCPVRGQEMDMAAVLKDIPGQDDPAAPPPRAPAPRAYELSTIFKPHCIVCRLLPLKNFQLKAAAISIIETSQGCSTPEGGACAGKSMGYCLSERGITAECL